MKLEDTDPQRVRGRIRWHAEMGLSSFETMPPEEAADFARWKLQTIVGLLDRLDDADRTSRIFRLVGIEVGRDGEVLVRDDDAG